MSDVQVRARHRGFSLVELLVAMVIALVVMAGVVNSFLASKDAFRFNEELAFIQENGRYAVELLSRNIREAGYFGCDNRNAIVVNSVDSDLDQFLGLTGVLGFEGGVDTFPAQFDDAWGNTDAIIIRRGDTDNSFPVDSHDVNFAQFSIVGAHNYDPGTIFIVSDSDCRHQGIFAMSGPDSSGADSIVVHNAGGGLSPSNCTKSIKGSGSGDSNGNGYFDCGDGCGANSCAWSLSEPYGKDALLMAMKADAFFVAASSVDPQLPALYSESLGNAGVITRNELVSGVEDFQITYGIDSDGNGEADRYFDADEVTAANGWASVVAVRIEMVLRSRNPILPENEGRTLLGVAYNDRFLRQVVTSTIRIRNYYG
jgi:type IV pilus assembly protein PilW